MSGPLFSAGASPRKFLRTNAGVRPIGQYGLSGRTGRLHQENLGYLNRANSSFQVSKLMLEVDKKLAHVGNEARKMGRSFSLLVAIKNIRQQLVNIELLGSSAPGPIERFSREDEPDDHEPVLLPKRRTDDMRSLVQALEVFRKCIQDFREYDDEMINIKGALRELCSDIKYWACSLDTYANSDSSIAGEYANQIVNELKNRIAKMASNLELFTEIGMPAIRYEQKRRGAVLLALSTGATFFSGVTATMLQISYTTPTNPGITTVNTFWFCSLVLSIGAAINSLLAMVWKQTFHGFRGSKLPRWLTWWINGSPPFFLFLSIICFSAGIVLFAFSSNQNPFTSWFTLAATAITSSAFSANILWMCREQIAAWISPETPPGTTPGPNENISSQNNQFTIRSHVRSNSNPRFSPRDTEESGRSMSGIDMLRGRLGPETTISTISSSSVTDRAQLPSSQWSDSPEIKYVQGEGKAQGIEPKLVGYVSLKEFGTLRDFKRSPNGIYLATTSWATSTSASTTVIFCGTDKGEYCSRQVFKTTMKSSRGPRQLTWSHDNNHLIIRHDKVIDIWTLQPRQLKRITRNDPIQSVRLYEQEPAFLYVTKHWVCKLGFDGKEIWGHPFRDIFLYDVSVASNNRLILLGHVASFQDDIKPSHPTVAEKQIRVHQIEDEKKLANFSQRKSSGSMPRIPTLENVNHITLTNNRNEFVVTYRGQKHPEIWTLSDDFDSPELRLKSLYSSKFKDEFEGVSYALRDAKSSLVISTGRAGDIHLWDPRDGNSIHRFRVGGNSFMSTLFSQTDGVIEFATANPNGVSIWEFGF